MTMQYFMAQVYKQGESARNSFFIGGYHYTVSGFIRQLNEQGYEVITAYITKPDIAKPDIEL